MRRNLFFVSLMILSLLSGCMRSATNSQSLESTKYLLGTIVTIKLYDHASDELMQEVFDCIADIEHKMSINLEDSEVSKINLNAGVEPVSVSRNTFEVIEKALEYGELSEGRFDITLGPVIELWGIGTEEEKVPAKEELLKALRLVNFKNVLIDTEKQTVFLSQGGMKINLGGIAKGYAADQVALLLKENNVQKAMINLGGNVYALGEKDTDTPWKIGIQSPFLEHNDYFGIVEISNQTVVTSGIYERYFEEEGKSYHHILNNQTGFPVDNEVAGVTIIGKSSVDADALSTILLSMGTQDGLEFIKNFENTECIYVNKDQEVTISKGLESNFVIKDSDFILKNP